MTLPFVTFLAVIACWIGFGAVYAFRGRLPQAIESRRNPAARVGILIQMLGFAFVWTMRRNPIVPILPMSMPVEIIICVVTIAMAVASVLLVLLAVRTLGKQWALAARVVEGHKLITHGPYSLVRNPIYLGMFGLLISTGLATSYWYALVTAIIVFLTGTIMRVRSEERLLRETFGTEFDDYTRRVKALIPWIF